MIHIYDSSKGFLNPGRRTEKIEGDTRVKGGGKYGVKLKGLTLSSEESRNQGN